MPRVKRGTQHVKKRKNILSLAKGYKWGRKKLITLAKVAITKAGAYRYRDRRRKKRDFRRLWNIKINAAVRLNGLSYSKFIGGLKKHNIELDRKILADLAVNNPDILQKITEIVKMKKGD